MHQPGARDVATYNDGMHHAGGSETPPATSPGFAGLRARAKSTHSRGVGLGVLQGPAELAARQEGGRSEEASTFN